eukprot:TRINITY_DN5951_c0_g2_i1.p1 TRINITY_DN5951_c0_g2~~TRINITY_DN5951_c0_g2_i1.p1  ORF type:complete len:368 (+),score=47.80 TRINITY_DN5951_c0_g2_i1:67-1104(+)
MVDSSSAERTMIEIAPIGHSSHVEQAVPNGNFSVDDVDVPQLVEIQEDTTPSRRAVAIAIMLYAACSSTLMVINKVSVHLSKSASVVLLSQFAFSALGVRVFKAAKPHEDVEFLQLPKVKAFFPACLIFFLCLLSNTEALGVSNVETVIAARCCTPIAVAVVERLWMGTDLPSSRGLLSLGGIIVGGAIYAMSDAGLQLFQSLWLLVYFVSLVIETVFVKMIIETLQMSTWTRVYYNNTISIPLVLAALVINGDTSVTMIEGWTSEQTVVIFLSCLVGLGISYAGFHLRKLVTATSFSVVGVVCKLITVLLNDVIWTHHSNAVGHCGILVCIAACYAYEQSKKKS